MATPKLVQPGIRLRARLRKVGEWFDDHAAVYALRLAQHLDECASSSGAQCHLAEQLLLIVGIASDQPPPLREMKRRLARVVWPVPDRSAPAFANVSFLARTLCLTPTETALLELAIVVAHHNVLLDVFQHIEPVTRTNAMRKLALVLDVDARELLKATQHGRLQQLGVISPYEAKDTLDTAVELPNDVLLALTEQYDDQQRLLDGFVQSSAPTALNVANFGHLQNDIDWLTRYLSNALAQRLRGVNVLLWGPPGTGKTEFAKVLADALACRLFEVRDDDREGIPSGGAERCRAFQLAQACFERSGRTLILFDEADEVFPGIDTLFGATKNSRGTKAWLNRLLESNPVPAIWIMNCLEDIETCYRRRFQYSVEFDTPPRTVRGAIIRQHFADLPLSDEAARRLAEHDHVTPGQIAYAAQSATVANVSGDQIVAFVGQCIEHSSALLELEPSRTIRRVPRNVIDLSLLNTDLDLPALVERMALQPATAATSWLLHGPSGSGKTSFAHHLAGCLDRPLLAKSGSDLLGRYVGDTEKGIREAFKQAAAEQAVLLFDEADSLLTDRSRAHSSWEFSQVNELLLQMEHFDGVFICATNMVGVLDVAAMRRFKIKIGFRCLKPESRLRMAHELLPDLSEAELTALGVALQPFKRATIGDFVNVMERARLLGAGITMDELIRQLHEELSLKDALASSAIGFHSPL